MSYSNSGLTLGAAAVALSLGSTADVTRAYMAHGVTPSANTVQQWVDEIAKGQTTWDGMTTELTRVYGPPKSEMPGDPTAASIQAAYKAHGGIVASQSTVLDWIRAFDAGATWASFLAELDRAYGPATAPLPAGPGTTTVTNNFFGIKPSTLAWLIGGLAVARALR